MPSLSILIPAYNEADLIAETIQQSCAYLTCNYPDSELLIVDDGSSDATPRIVADLAQTFAEVLPVRLLSNGKNCGKGQSIKNGVQAAQGQFVIFYDADLPYDLSGIRDMLGRLASGFDVVAGSRVQPGAVIDSGVPSVRRLASKIYRAIVHALIDIDVQDTQCGFKGFSSAAARDIFNRVTIQGFGFDIEALSLAQRLGYRITTVPVKMLKTRHASRIKLARDAVLMLGDILRVAFHSRAGKSLPVRRTEES